MTLHDSTALYLTLLDSTALYMTLLDFTALYLTLLASTALYNGSIYLYCTLYFTLLYSAMALLDST